jgi:hypothetical protein
VFWDVSERLEGSVKTYCYSFDEEVFSGDFETREEALDAGIVDKLESDHCLEPGNVFYVWTAECAPPRPASSYLPSAWWAVDHLQSNASDELSDGAPDIAGKWLENVDRDLVDSLSQKLAAAVDQWATENNLHPEWHDVRAVKEHHVDVTREMLGDET